MATGDVNNRGARRRRAFGQNQLEARNTQAARDALRRRQKEKKARIVKRHVRYKQKQKLLKQLEISERASPIVATELCREGDDEIEANNGSHRNTRRTDHMSVNAEEVENVGESKGDGEGEDAGTKEKPVNPASQTTAEATSDRQPPKDEPQPRTPVAKKEKYIPFMKEQKEYQRVMEEKEAQRREHQEKIEEREQMLRRSKKGRKAKAKQVRKVTSRGQPKLKYRLAAMLARIEKQ